MNIRAEVVQFKLVPWSILLILLLFPAVNVQVLQQHFKNAIPPFHHVAQKDAGQPNTFHVEKCNFLTNLLVKKKGIF